jgi:hypothetical protein
MAWGVGLSFSLIPKASVHQIGAKPKRQSDSWAALRLVVIALAEHECCIIVCSIWWVCQAQGALMAPAQAERYRGSR